MGNGDATADHTYEIFGRRFQSIGVEAPLSIPDGYLISEAYPNPINTATSFTLALNAPEHVDVDVDVFDMLGRRVAVLFCGSVSPHRLLRLSFDAVSLPSGSYFIRVVGESFGAARKVLFLK